LFWKIAECNRHDIWLRESQTDLFGDDFLREIQRR
jgi:hypothetical protein